MNAAQRAAATAAWMEEYRNVGGGPWLGRAAMAAAKTARVAALESSLATEHTSNGHGPFVVNYQVGTGPRSAVADNQDVSDANQGTLRTRRCTCGTTFTQAQTPTILDDRTFDGFTRDLREVSWPGDFFGPQQFPPQPRDTAAIRGVEVLMPTMIEGSRP